MQTLTELQAFDAMCRFLRDHSDGSHTLAKLLEELTWSHVWEGEPMTFLPGIWSDWQAAVAQAKSSAVPGFVYPPTDSPESQ